jgi:hypothetical protein
LAKLLLRAVLVVESLGRFGCRLEAGQLQAGAVFMQQL